MLASSNKTASKRILLIVVSIVALDKVVAMIFELLIISLSFSFISSFTDSVY